MRLGYRVAGLVLALTFSGVALPVHAASPFPAPQAPPDMLASLRAALADAPAPDGADFWVPEPETAKAYALGVLAAEGTPARVAATLDAVERGEDVGVRDYLIANTLLHYAGPGFAGDALSALARGVVAEALPLRVATNAVPMGTQVVPPLPVAPPALPPAPGAPEPVLPAAPGQQDLAASSFGPVEVLSTTGRLLRTDVLQVQTERTLDYGYVLTTLQQEYRESVFRDYYSYYYQDFWFTYNFFYDFASRETSTDSYLDSIAYSLHRYTQHFDRWEFTSGVNVQVFQQVAPLGEDACAGLPEAQVCAGALGQAHMLYALLTPYAYIDHWWLMIFFEDITLQLFHAESHTYSRYWTEATSYYERSGGVSDASSSSFLRSFRFTTFTSEQGYERIPVDDLVALSGLRITVAAPLDQYLALARGDNRVVDLRTAVQLALPTQINVGYEDAKLSELLATTPSLSDLLLVVDEEPHLSAALARADEVALVGDTLVMAVLDAAEGALGGLPGDPVQVLAPIAADPAAFAAGTAAALEAQLTAAAAPAEQLAMALVADPQAFAGGKVAEALAAAAEAQAGALAALDDGATLEVPDLPVPAFLVAAYDALEARTGTKSGAGFGLITLNSYPVDSDPVLVRITAAGLGLPVLFRVHLQAGLVEEVVVDPEIPAAPAPPAPPLPLAGASLRDRVEAMGQAVLAMPAETSFPAFALREGLLAEPAAWARSYVQEHMGPELLAATLLATEHSSEASPVPHLEFLEASVVLYYAGPGYEEDPAMGAWAREVLAAALPLYLAARGPLQAQQVQPPLPQLPAPDPAPVLAEVQGTALGVAMPHVQRAALAPLDQVRLVAIDGRELGRETVIGDVQSYAYFADLFESYYRTESRYTEYFESIVQYGWWANYFERRYTDSASAFASYEGTLQQWEEFRLHYERSDLVDGFVAALVVTGGSNGAAAGAAIPALPQVPAQCPPSPVPCGNPLPALPPAPCPPPAPCALPALPGGVGVAVSGLDGDVVYTVTLPFRFNADWFVSLAYDAYQRDYLSQWQAWQAYYTFYVSNQGSGSFYSESQTGGSFGSTFVQTSFSVADAFEVVAVPNALLSEGLEIDVYVPLKEHALMAQGPPFDMRTVFAGSLPGQVEPSRAGEFYGEHLVISPAPNDLNIAIDDDPLLTKPGEVLGSAELAARAEAALLQAKLERLALDPVGEVRDALLPLVPGVPTVDPPAPPAPPQLPAPPQAPPLPNPDALKAQLLAEVDEAQTLVADIVTDPQSHIDALTALAQAQAAAVQAQAAAAEAAVRAQSLDIAPVPLPSEVEDHMTWEVVFQASSLAAFRPGVTVVGLVGLDGATLIDPELVRVAIRGQGLEGSGALGATGPFLVTFTADLNGQGPLPGSTPPVHLNAGQALDEAEAAAAQLPGGPPEAPPLTVPPEPPQLPPPPGPPEPPPQLCRFSPLVCSAIPQGGPDVTFPVEGLEEVVA